MLVRKLAPARGRQEETKERQTTSGRFINKRTWEVGLGLPKDEQVSARTHENLEFTHGFGHAHRPDGLYTSLPQAASLGQLLPPARPAEHTFQE